MNSSNTPMNKGTGSIFHKTRLCPKFQYCGTCRYGDQCAFAHAVGELREPAPNSQGVIGRQDTSSNEQNSMHTFNKFKGPVPMNKSPRESCAITILTPKLCSTWKMTGDCPFGDKCHFSHVQADFQLPDVQIEEKEVNLVSSIPPATNPGHTPDTTTTEVAAAPSTLTTVKGFKKLYENWEGPREINGIYGDWLDGMEPPQMDPKDFES